MHKVHMVSNEDVKRALVGVPKGHKHVRICVELETGLSLIIQEATIANILRAYITVKTHPNIRAQELEMQTLSLEQRKEGYAVHQLIETPKKSKQIEIELRELLEKSEPLP